MSDKKRDTADADGKLLADLCNEAVMRCGADWPAIEKHIANEIRSMDEGERSHLIQKVREILDFAPPVRRPDSIQ